MGRHRAWGYDNEGELGNGTTSASGTPTPVAVSLPQGVTARAITAGSFTAAVVTSTRAVYAWGFNNHGQVGDGSETNRSVPVAVKLPAGTAVTALAGEEYNLLALTSTGRVYAWGRGDVGGLGNGGSADRATPMAVSLPSGTTVKALGSGGFDGLALTTGGQLFGWGFDGEGQIGNGKTNGVQSVPVAASLPTATIATSVSQGYAFGAVATVTHPSTS